MKKFLFVLLGVLILGLLMHFFQSKPKSFPISQYPDRVLLVDTGRDLCHFKGGINCEKNHNLLVRGSIPLNLHDKSHQVQSFRQSLIEQLSTYMVNFAPDDIKRLGRENLEKLLYSYRIVVINLVYGEKSENYERLNLIYEFNQLNSTPKENKIPDRDKIYNLTAPFDQNTFAFLWHPITLSGTDATAALDSLVQRSGKLESLLLQDPADGHPLLIFYHCMSGKDRTGAVTMAYFMLNGGYSPKNDLRRNPMRYEEALQSNMLHQYLFPNNKARKLAFGYCKTVLDANDRCESYWISELKLILNRHFTSSIYKD